MEQDTVVGSSWADFARDLLAFAREEPILFFAIFAPLVVLVIGCGWWIYPRFTRTAKDYYDFELEKHRLKREQEPFLPLEVSDNDSSNG